MAILDKKLLRTFKSIRSQVLAIALVVSSGAASLILAGGSYRSLLDTRELYYQSYNFAHVFANARRAPESVARQIGEYDGVLAVETRVIGDVLLDIDGAKKPVSGRIISLPNDSTSMLNGLYLRAGRLPDAMRSDEVVVNETFAKAQGFRIGSRLTANINGNAQALTISGIALSPEFIFARRGTALPDPRQYGVLWMPETVVANAYDMVGTFNSISVKLRHGASVPGVIAELDRLLEPYGGSQLLPRKRQSSHAFIEAMLNVLSTMSYVSPPIFLAVAAFLINITLGRLIAIERVQIGLLKALGFRSSTIAFHYLKLISIITSIGVLAGLVIGTYLGHWMTSFYSSLYNFPFFVFRGSPDLYIIASAACFGAAILGALHALHRILELAPAVAMAPAAPVRYGRMFPRLQNWKIDYSQFLPLTTTMILRHLIRFPIRSGLTLLGVALSIMLLIGSLVFGPALDQMIDISYYKMFRATANLQFTKGQPMGVVHEISRLPGVLMAEPRRVVAAKVSFEQAGRQLNVTGVSPDSKMVQIMDRDGSIVTMPAFGVVITEKLAEILKISLGDELEIRTMEGKRRIFHEPVTVIAKGYMGLFVFMDLERLNSAMGEGASISSVDLYTDSTRLSELFEAIKKLPSIATMSSLRDTVQRFQKTLARNIIIMAGIFITLSVTIDIGVIYNGARIQLSERSRELASLRVLGFTQGEVSKILLGEFAILVALALPLGCVLGKYYTMHLLGAMNNEVYRLPVFISNKIYIQASLIAIAAAFLSAFIVHKSLHKLDIVEALKARE